MKLSIKEVLKFSWNKVMDHFWKFVVIAIVSIVFECGSQFFAKDIPPLGLTGILISLIFSTTIIKICLKAVRNQPFEITDLFTISGREFVGYTLTRFVTVLISVGGFILLIIPGFIWMYKYMFAVYFAVDKKLPVGESLKESARITHGHKWKLFLFTLTYVGIAFAGLCVFGIGIVVAISVIMISQAYIFEKLCSANLPQPVETTSITVAS